MLLDSTDCLSMDVLKAFFGWRWFGLFLAADRGMLEALGLLLKVGKLGQEISRKTVCVDGVAFVPCAWVACTLG